MTLEVRAVHPTDTQNRLRYGLAVSGGGTRTKVDPDTASRFEVEVPSGRDVKIFIRVADVASLDQKDVAVLVARVRPRDV